MSYSSRYNAEEGIAIVGMAGRFPGAKSLEQFWQNLLDAVETIAHFSDEELESVEPSDLEDRVKSTYVRARGILDDIDMFDANFFGISPREAELLDPQHRIFLEIVSEALDDAGYDPRRFKGVIGLYAGTNDNTYYLQNLFNRRDVIDSAGRDLATRGNSNEYLTTRVAYKLDLRGPAINIQTACSTSLVAVCSAVQSLNTFQCDMALAGGVSIMLPQRRGYLWQEGYIFSPDGHVRAFDRDARGTVFSNGAGVVALRRLDDALRDGDHIYAVIKGTGLNNDGSAKVSYIAPSVDGQAEAISMAQAVGGIDPETVSYIEAHGSGTELGDCIEIAALTHAFRAGGARENGFCAIGSVKTNIGHADAAAGVAGLIKTVLALHHKLLPASLHFKSPNPKLGLEHSPFYVNAQLRPWQSGALPRRAGVSSFGVGGTNAHIVLEEAPLKRRSGGSRPMQLLPLSARTATALDAYGKSLAMHLGARPNEYFSDTAYTLQNGRKQMAERLFVVAKDSKEAAELLTNPNPLRCGRKQCERRDPPVVFMFGGQGNQYVNMGRTLYQGESVFREIIDNCCKILKPYLGCDLREVLYPRSEDEETARLSLNNTLYTQPSIFVIEYALARFWQGLGVQPAIMVGHSIGEFVAAALADVWDLEDVLRIIALRGRLMQELPRGAMLSVGCSAETAENALPPSVQIASINAPSRCVVAGPEQDVATIKKILEGQDIDCQLLHTSHAFHSAMMEPILGALQAEVAGVKLRAPTIPFVSTVSGKLITAAETTDPWYWVQHARATVQFAKAVQHLVERDYDLFLECGPRSTLSTLVRQQCTPEKAITTIPSLPNIHKDNTELATVLFALGSLWQNGVSIDWKAFHAHEDRRRVPLPPYPFERQRYWVDAARNSKHDTTLPLQPPRLMSESNISKQQSPSESYSTVCERAGTNGGRKDRITERLVEILGSFSSRGDSTICTSASFLQEGLDSLSLTQVAMAIQKEFEVEVTSVQLMDEFPSVDVLAAHIDNALPPDRFAVSASPTLDAANGPAIVADTAAEDRAREVSLEAIIAEQARTISQLVDQLITLGAAPIRPTVQPVTARVEAPIAEAGTASSTAARQPDETLLALPTTADQRNILVASMLSDDASRTYNQVAAFNLYGVLNIEALRASFQDIVGRHEVLRVTFSADGQEQFIHPAWPEEPSLIDLSAISQSEQGSRFKELTAEFNETLFDLVNGPLVKAQLIRLSENEHVLQLIFHHSIIDGWSMNLIASELSELYSAKATDNTIQLKQAMRYREYIAWYHDAKNSDVRQEAEKYWLQSLSDLPSAVELPLKGPRPLQRSYRSGYGDITIERELYAALRKVSARAGCTLFHFLLATFTTWLSRISGQDDIIVGVPFAGQLAANLQGIPGSDRLASQCARVYPIRSKLSKDIQFLDFLAHIKRTVLDAKTHEGVDIGDLIAKLNPPRSPACHPFISVTFNLNSAARIGWHNLKVDTRPIPRTYVFYDLVVNATEIGGGLRIACQYADDLFDSKTMETWLSQWKLLMVSAVETPVSPLAQLEMMGQVDRAELLVKWNAVAADYSHEQCVHELFEAQVKRAPERVAVKTEGEVLSYGELDMLATRIAQALRARGVERGQHVGLCVERGAEMLAAVLGVLKAGAAYVPLDPAFPQERLRFMARDAELTLLVSTAALAEPFGLPRERQLLLDADAAVIASQSDQGLSPDAALDARPEDPAYVIYTSGSTGQPKGVVVPHRAVVNFLTSMAREPGLSADDVLVAVTTLSFDIAVLELQLPLTVGATVVIASGDEAMDGQALKGLLEAHGATVMQATPVTWRLLLEAGWTGKAPVKALVGGEALPKGLADQLIGRGIELWNMYGPTETTVWSTCARITDTANGITIGKPIANTAVYILDTHQNLCPIGVPGELCIGGAGVTLGYWKRPELTAERFIPDPFSTAPGATLYRTGDRARWRNDGTLEHLGRLDDQVKVRGFRVELGEIEAALAEHPEVRQAVVHLWTVNAEDVRIVACCVPVRAGALAPVSLRRHLRTRLPDYMIPQHFLPVGEIALTPNGKVDRLRLPTPVATESAIGRDEVPADPIEVTIAEIWTQLLQPARAIGRNDRFLEMGGHSFLALRALRQIESKLGEGLSVRTLLQGSLADVAALFRSLQTNK